MNIKTVLKVISVLVLIVSGFMIIPGLIALFYQEIKELYSFLIAIGISLLSASLILILLRKDKQSVLSTKGGFLLVTLSWITVSFFGAIPFYLSEAIPSVADAFFETMSGFTTTGASILTDIESLPKSLLFWRSLTHWLGGMGIIVLTVAILPLLGIGGLQLIKAEAPGPTVDKLTPRITETAKILWVIYLGMTILQTVLLLFGGLDLFDALTHTFGTLATGGFSPKNASVGHYDSAFVDGVVTFFMIMAGINFALHFRLITGKVKYHLRDTELHTYLAIFLIATTLIVIMTYGDTYETIGQSIRYASFQAASILTTTGYATTNFEEWPHFAQIVLFLLMFIGGCSGSTGGGIKVVRIVTLFKLSINELRFLLHPRGIFTLKISGTPLKKDVLQAIAGFFYLYILLILIVTLIVATAEEDILTALTTALATVGNIGPGFGNIGPAENYAFYPPYVKWVLSVAMLIGRLEIYTVIILFTPTFWKR